MGVASGDVVEVLALPGKPPGGSGPVEIRSSIEGRNTGLDPAPGGGLGLRLMLRGVAMPETPESIIPLGGEVGLALLAGEMTLISSSKKLRRFALPDDSAIDDE